MDYSKILSDFEELSKSCKESALILDNPEINDIVGKLRFAIDKIGKSWCRSFIGYHAYIYYSNFESPPAGAHFSPEWGFVEAFSNPITGDWQEYSYDDVYDKIVSIANQPDINKLTIQSNLAEEKFTNAKDEALTLLEILISKDSEKFYEDRKSEIEKIKLISREDFLKSQIPQGQFFSRDSLAMSQGIKFPPHKSIEAMLMSMLSPQFNLQSLSSILRKTSTFISKKVTYTGVTMKTEQKIFIGHGRSLIWRELKDFINDRLKLDWDEFNREPVAGYSVKDRLSEMLEKSLFAFIIMTAEDEHSDKTLHARENVIHEVGLFQGKLGFNKAIVLLEDGCTEFSNIHGLIQIRFPKNNISACFEEIRRVLEREKIL